jgi:hypothetical protein
MLAEYNMKTYTKLLNEQLGGTWKYDGVGSWRCDDNKRHVSRVSAGVDEWDNSVGPAQKWLYGDGIPQPEHEFMKQSFVTLRYKHSIFDLLNG